MKVTFIRKTALSNETNCPALYRTDHGTFLVQGKIVNDTRALAQIRHLAADETVVEVPDDVLAEIAAARS